MQLPLGVPVASDGTPIRLDARASGSIMPAPLPIDGTDSRASGANSAPAGGLVLGTMLQAASEEEARISSVRPCPCDQGVPHYQASFSEAGQATAVHSLRASESIIDESSATQGPRALPTQLAAAVLRYRPGKMFVAGLGPLASGEGAAVEESNNGLIKFTAEIIEEADGVLALPALKRKPVHCDALHGEHEGTCSAMAAGKHTRIP